MLWEWGLEQRWQKEWSVHLCNDGRRDLKSIQPPPNHIADEFKSTASRALSGLGALISARAVAALPGDGGEFVIVFC